MIEKVIEEVQEVELSEHDLMANALIDKNEVQELLYRDPKELAAPLSNEMMIEIFFDEFNFISGFRTNRTQKGNSPIKKNLYVIRKDELSSLISFLSGRLVKTTTSGAANVSFGTLHLKEFSSQDIAVQSIDNNGFHENAVESIANNL